MNESKKVTTTIVSDELKEWYNKNKLLIKTLGLSHSEAYFQKARISKLAHDIGVFWYKMIWFWGIYATHLTPPVGVSSAFCAGWG